MSRWPHLGSCPEHFEEFADIVMVVGTQRIPAHSQYLAGHSKLMQNLTRDSPSFSKDAPLVLDQQLQGFEASELQSFLNQVCLSPVLSSSAEAFALLRLADLFDAAKLMGKAVAYLEETAAGELYASSGATLKSAFGRKAQLRVFYKTMCQPCSHPVHTDPSRSALQSAGPGSAEGNHGQPAYACRCLSCDVV